jgi:uncharacterized membrane protein
MPIFSHLDLIALVWFLAAWIGYSVVIEMTPHGKAGLNGLMHRYRGLWMFHSTEDMLTIIGVLPFGAPVSHTKWEVR